jgi:hypothetical protein
MNFAGKLQYGQVGESKIAKWLNSRGYSVLPVYEVEMNTGKGPRLFAPSKKLIAPDMFAFKADNQIWIEAKHKTAFSWHRITGQWVTGIDLKHYLDYCEIDAYSPFRVWLMFLHDGGQAKDSPPNSPAGLFGNKIEILKGCENHRHNNWGKSGMVYWSMNSLKKLAPIEQFV